MRNLKIRLDSNTREWLQRVSRGYSLSRTVEEVLIQALDRNLEELPLPRGVQAQMVNATINEALALCLALREGKSLASTAAGLLRAAQRAGIGPA